MSFAEPAKNVSFVSGTTAGESSAPTAELDVTASAKAIAAAMLSMKAGTGGAAAASGSAGSVAASTFASAGQVDTSVIQGHFLSVMSPVGGPALLSRWHLGEQVYPPVPHRGRRDSTTTNTSTGATSSHASEAAALAAEQLIQGHLVWLMRLLLLDYAPAPTRMREDLVDLQVTSAIRIVQVNQLDLTCIALTWRDQPLQASEEYSIPMFCACFYAHSRFTPRLHAVFATIRDRMEILLKRLLTLMDSLEQSDASSAADVTASQVVLTCTDARLAAVWDSELVAVGTALEKLLTAKVERIHLNRCLCEMTFLRELSLSPKQSKYPNGLVQAVINAALGSHRCIIFSDDVEEAVRWVRTICQFLTDEQLLTTTLKVATSVDDIVPDARLQALVVAATEAQQPIGLNTPGIAEKLPRKLLDFRYPVTVINVKRHFSASEHIVPESLSVAVALKRYCERRLDVLCEMEPAVAAARAGKVSTSSLRKLSPLVATFLQQIRRVVEGVNNQAMRDNRTYTNVSYDSMGASQHGFPPSSRGFGGGGGAPGGATTAMNTLFSLLTPRPSRHDLAGDGPSQSPDSVHASGPQSTRSDSNPATPYVPAPPPTALGTSLHLNSPGVATSGSTVVTFASYVDPTEAFKWDGLAQRLLLPRLERWRQSMLLRAVRHVFLESSQHARNAVPPVQEEDTDLLCAIMEKVPLELAEHRVSQAIQNISSRMKAF
jgi:hypothetical protein